MRFEMTRGPAALATWTAHLTLCAILFAGPAQAADRAPPLVAANAAAASDSFRMTDVSKGSAQPTSVGEGDAQFRSLFNAWGIGATTGAGGTTTAIVPKAEIYVPSIRPVRAARQTSAYGYRTDPFVGRRKNHKGIDLAGPIGTPIYATADGVVGRAQWVSGYGKYIELNHGNSVQTRYGHLSALNVAPNQRVRKGDVIGYMGSTGRSTGSHLHYEVRISGEPVNPLAFMGDDTDVTKDLMIVDGGDTDAVGGPTGN